MKIYEFTDGTTIYKIKERDIKEGTAYFDLVALGDVPFEEVEEVFEPISSRQIRLALLGAGIDLAQIDTAIDEFSEPTKSAVKIAWEYSTTYYREDPNIIGLGAAIGLTPEQIDDIWIGALII